MLTSSDHHWFMHAKVAGSAINYINKATGARMHTRQAQAKPDGLKMVRSGRQGFEAESSALHTLQDTSVSAMVSAPA
jgi:hypothetical protein